MKQRDAMMVRKTQPVWFVYQWIAYKYTAVSTLSDSYVFYLNELQRRCLTIIVSTPIKQNR